MKKPHYKVPTMEEIKTIEHNGFYVVSTFSGCGGSCLGYRMAGFKVLWANEFIPAAQETYKANHPQSILDTRDIRQVQPEEILAVIGKKRGELDLFDGSPPCASFSIAGKREKGWGTIKEYSDTKQRTDDLFFEYIRIMNGLQPKVFIAENVSGLISGVAKGYFKIILSELKSCGYSVTSRVLNAQWLGVPQMRQRLIFMGVRNDLALMPIFPEPLPYFYTLQDAIENINDPGEYRKLTPGDLRYQYYFKTSPGDTKGLARASIRERGKDSLFTHFRLSFDRPVNTIMQSTASLYHPTIPRTLGINELKRVGGFPDDFILTGFFPQQWERIGRAVPPLMMAKIAKTIEQGILKKL